MKNVLNLEKKLKKLEKEAKKITDFIQLKELFEEYYLVYEELKIVKLDLVSERSVF
ncbi:MAG: hypothetical protein ACRC2K_13430 [Clostridium sp.]